MTNEEKYKDVIKRMTRRYPPLHPAVLNGKVVPCTGLNCAYCDLSTPPYHGGCNDNYEKWLKSEAESEKSEPEKPKQERMVTRTVSNAKGEEVVYYNILYGFGRQDVLEKLYHYEQEEEEEKMEKDKIKVGDTVKVTMKNHMREGRTAIVRKILSTSTGKFYGVHLDGDSDGWVFTDREIEKVKPENKDVKMEKDEIKVGDTVKVTEDPLLKGKTGIVRRIYCTNNGKPYVVNFDKNFCWTFSDHEIVKVKSKKTPPRIVVYRDGDTVTAKDLETGETASAVCNKKDTFDIHTGAFIATARLTGFMDDIKMMRLETEQIEEDIADMKMRFGALMGEGYKQPEGFSRKEEA